MLQLKTYTFTHFVSMFNKAAHEMTIYTVHIHLQTQPFTNKNKDPFAINIDLNYQASR